MDHKDQYDVYGSISDLTKADQELIEAAKEASATSYSPYSDFQVGCAIRLENGKLIMGSNQENASFPAGNCAENITLNTCGVLHPRVNILNIAVIARKKSDVAFSPVAPCGICRQIMVEYETRQQKAISMLMQIGNMNWVKTHNCSMLLPFSFSKDNL